MTLYVINPNSTEAVTQGIDRSVDAFRQTLGPIRCLTLAEGPPGIESDEDVASVVKPLLDLIHATKDASAFVVACFSDPGVELFRSLQSVPVVGIREAAVTMALRQGERFGVIAIGEASIRRHLVAFDAMNVTKNMAGDRALGLSVTDLSDQDLCAERMLEIATQLRDKDGADVLIMGCAGMVEYRSMLAMETGLPVVEPCQAAVALAIEQITLQH